MKLALLILALSGVMAFGGTASWYGQECAGKTMANGHPFIPSRLTCASWNYPLGTRLLVRHKNRSVIVTVTDRGPARRLKREIDLSWAAFKALADPKVGLISVTIEKVK